MQHSFEHSVNKQKHYFGLNSAGFWNFPSSTVTPFPLHKLTKVRLLTPYMTLQKLYSAKVSIYLELQVMQTGQQGGWMPPHYGHYQIIIQNSLENFGDKVCHHW